MNNKMDVIDVRLFVSGDNYKIGTPPQSDKIYCSPDDCTHIGDPVLNNRASLGVAKWESVNYHHVVDRQEYRIVIGDFISFLKEHHKEFVEKGADQIELCIWLHTTSNEVQSDLLMSSEISQLLDYGVTDITFDVIHYSQREFKVLFKNVPR